MFALDGVLALTLVVPLWRFRRAVPRAPGLLGGPRLETQRRLLRDRRATLVYAAVFVEGAAFFGGLGYLGALLHDKYRLSLDEIGLVLVLDGVALLVTSRLLGRIAPRLGENRMILTGAQPPSSASSSRAADTERSSSRAASRSCSSESPPRASPRRRPPRTRLEPGSPPWGSIASAASSGRARALGRRRARARTDRRAARPARAHHASRSCAASRPP